MSRKKNENPLFTLNGRRLGRYKLYLGEVKKGRFTAESIFSLFLEDVTNKISRPVITGRYFAGSGEWLRPWMEFNYDSLVEFGDEELVSYNLKDSGQDEELFKILSELIPPGGHMMVKYSEHKSTA